MEDGAEGTAFCSPYSFSGQASKVRRDQHAQGKPPPPLLFLLWLECMRLSPNWSSLQTSFSKLAVSWFLVPELDEQNWYFTDYYLGMCILLWFPLFYLCYKLNAVWYWVLVNVWWYRNCQCLREWRVVKSHYKVVLWTYFYPQKFHP